MIRTVLPFLIGGLFVASLIWGPRRVWAAWKRFGQTIGDTLARIVMTIFYFTILVPFALITQGRRDPLSEKSAGGRLWQSRPVVAEGELADAAKQY